MADQNSSGGNPINSGAQAGGRRNPADNLTRDDRVRGGERSAAMQTRDSTGQFAGRKGSEGNRGSGGTGGGPGRNAGNR